ncbi:hypothetical protein ACQP2K_21675 [Microbispora siamensis]
MVAALAGNVDEVLTGSVRFLDAWRRAGSPARSILAPAVAGVAMIHGLRDDHDARREWQEILDQLGTPPERMHGYGAVFDAMLLLHHGRAPEALERMAPEPRQVWKWVTWIWHHWYVALRAAAGAFDAADCRYQYARTLVLAGGDHAERGAAVLAGLGLAPMAPAPASTTTSER